MKALKYIALAVLLPLGVVAILLVLWLDNQTRNKSIS
jgi:hypothetical protein